MQVGSKACPSGGGSDCDSKDFYWVSLRSDQGIISGQDAFRFVCKAEAVTITKVTSSVSPVVPLPCVGCLLEWKTPNDVQSRNNCGMHGP